jgi:hypothetical protein
VIDFNSCGHTVELFNRNGFRPKGQQEAADQIERFLQDSGKPQAQILIEELSVSQIFSALQTLELEEHSEQANRSRSQVQLVVSKVRAKDFSVLKEFLASPADGLEQHEQQTRVSQEVQHATLTAVADDYSVLEERVARVAEVVKQERQERTAAEERTFLAEEEMSEQALRIEALEKELSARESERHRAHQRVKRMLILLDSLEL